MARRPVRLAFVSCNEAQWGGSEELWARAAQVFARDGYRVTVAKPRIDRQAPVLRALGEAGVGMADLARVPLLPQRLTNFLYFVARPVMFAWQLMRLYVHLRLARPDLVVLSQGGSWDGSYMEPVLARLRIPYVLICQKASDFYWPPDGLRDRVRRFVCGAEHVYFVSEHNHHLLEEQIGERLERASVVRNPFLVDHAAALPWPADGPTTRIACIGRFYPMEKGQDLLLRVLAQPKWQARAITVDFYGEGINRAGLEAMARLLGCANVRFCGQTNDIRALWASHHALILPSRAEGLPLVLVETMLAGRVAVVSRAGGSAEVVDDGTTGFLINGYDEAGLDQAMERAWARRSEWAEIGATAAAAIRTLVPEDPAADLAARIASQLGGPAGT